MRLRVVRAKMLTHMQIWRIRLKILRNNLRIARNTAMIWVIKKLIGESGESIGSSHE